MRVASINRALPKEVMINGRSTLTGIDKLPVKAPVKVERLGLDGDDQADKTVHGGPEQAVYCYSAEHYQHWQAYLSAGHLPYGTFGENLTLTKMDETDICLGDVLQIGSTQLQVTKPRIPCFKLAHKLERKAVIKDFLQSGYSGFYCRVLQSGEVAPNDVVTIVSRDAQRVSVKQALILQKLKLNQLSDAQSLLTKALMVTSLTPELKQDFEKRLNGLT